MGIMETQPNRPLTRKILTNLFVWLVSLVGFFGWFVWFVWLVGFLFGETQKAACRDDIV